MTFHSKCLFDAIMHDAVKKLHDVAYVHVYVLLCYISHCKDTLQVRLMELSPFCCVFTGLRFCRNLSNRMTFDKVIAKII